MVKQLSSRDLDGLPKHFVLLVNTGASNKIHSYYLLDDLQKYAIVLALSHPAHNIHNILGKIGVRREKVHYIDTISKRIQAGLALEGCHYMHESDLNSVMKAVAAVNDKLPMKENILFVDSLHHLFMQNDKDTILRFIDFMHRRLKLLRLNSIFVVDLSRLDNEVREKLERISDKILNIA